MANASTASAGAGVPTIATHVASPSAAPIWRNIVCTPMPVESWSGRSVAAAVAVKDGSISPTPVPVRICPGRIAVRYAGSAVAWVMNHRQPAANTKPPTAPNAAGWRPSASRPEVNAVVAASSGPGANAMPAWRIE